MKINKIDSCKLGMPKPLMEMARVGFFDEYEIYIHTDDPGNVPHFHIWDASTKGNNYHTCIKIEVPEYFHHTGKEDILNSKDKKDLVRFLKSKPKNERYDNYWQILMDEWNRNNSIIKIDPDQEMPDYTKL